MAKDDLYTVAQVAPDVFHVVKFDKVLRWEQMFYTVKRSRQNNLYCDCFAGRRHSCRHREMVRLFICGCKVGSNELYDYDKGEWA